MLLAAKEVKKGQLIKLEWDDPFRQVTKVTSGKELVIIHLEHHPDDIVCELEPLRGVVLKGFI